MEKTFRRQLVHTRQSLVRTLERLHPSAPLEEVSALLISSRQPWSDPRFAGDVPECLRREYIRWLDGTDEAYVRRFDGDIGIDPWSGHVFAGGRVVWGSTDYPLDRGRERSPQFLNHRFGSGRRFPALISLHHKFDTNYFHFINNVIAKLHLADRLGLDQALPVVVSARLGAQSYFRDAVRLGVFGSHEVVVQGPREVVRAGTVFTIKPHDPDEAALEATLDRFGIADKPEGERAVFIQRGANAPNRRPFRNQAEVDALLARHGIETADPQELALEAQIALFSASRLIIGAHGAGLTNIIWRRHAPGTLVELFNPTLGSPHYYMYARYLGQDYRCLMNLDPIGKPAYASSLVDIEQLRATLADVA
ncbi:MAG: glycosyltransferase family 61 protein [Hyphomicrobiales bacterium]